MKVRNLKRFCLLIVGVIFTPFLYLGFAASGLYMPLLPLYRSLFEYYATDKPFGGFDES